MSNFPSLPSVKAKPSTKRLSAGRLSISAQLMLPPFQETLTLASRSTIRAEQSHHCQSSKSETWKPRLNEHWRQERFL